MTAPKKTSCLNNTPPWFTGHWRNWHRGHGCAKDDGQPRSENAIAEIVQHEVNRDAGYLPGAGAQRQHHCPRSQMAPPSRSDLLLHTLAERAKAHGCGQVEARGKRETAPRILAEVRGTRKTDPPILAEHSHAVQDERKSVQPVLVSLSHSAQAARETALPALADRSGSAFPGSAEPPGSSKVEVCVLAIRPHPAQAESPGWWAVQLCVYHAGKSRTFWRWYTQYTLDKDGHYRAPSSDKEPSHDEIIASFWGGTFGKLHGFSFHSEAHASHDI